MNIIIVAKPFSTPRVVRLGDWRSFTLLGVVAIAILGLTLAAGAVVGAYVTGPANLRAELERARSALTEQQDELARMRESVGRDVDALAARLGKLQAEASRLNALGQRLAKAGKLDDGEFNFGKEPAMGGPEVPAPMATIAAGEVTKAIDALEARLSAQAEQLSLLEVVLLDRKLDQSLLPAGTPVRSGYVSSGFGYRADPLTGSMAFHAGVDFDGARGADILAVAGGVVSYSGQRPGYGNVVEIDHGNGYLTRYAHNLSNGVQVGDAVRAGDLIAKMGSTGRATGDHVHFEVWRDGKVVNPSQYIKAIR